MKKVLVCDFCMRGVGHVYFNSAFIKILLNTYSEGVFYCAETEQAKNVASAISSSRVTTHNILTFCPSGWKIIFADFWNSFVLLFVVLRYISKFEHIYILNRLPITMVIGNILNIIIRKKMFNVIHGEVEYLVNPNTSGGTKRYSYIFKLAYKFSTSNSVYITLGESIYDCLRRSKVTFGKGKIIIINHPYDYNYRGIDNCCYLSGDAYNVGCIGSATRRKNSQYIFELRNITNNPKINFSIVGELSSDIGNNYNSDGIRFYKSKIPSDVFEKEIQALDYSLCFYDNSINLALASGSFFDSIKYLKPILALRGNPFVDYYFDKLGDIGYRFDTLKDMSSFLSKLSNEEKENYAKQVKIMKEAQNALSLESITKDYQRQLSNFHLV